MCVCVSVCLVRETEKEKETVYIFKGFKRKLVQ